MALPVTGQTRVRVTVNDGWRFAEGEHAGAETPAFADSAWRRVDLPHTWNVEDAFDKAPGYRRGVGWYRRPLVLDEAVRGRRLFLYFEGANQVADVFVNGHHLGQHIGGYTAFVFDVTDYVSFDAPNVVAVRVDNRHDPDIPPLDADFTFYGGIYRDVWLVATAPVHADLLDHAGPGVYVDTPEITEQAATVRVRARVTNDGPEAVDALVRHRVIDAEGQPVASVETGQRVAAGATEIVISETTLPNPRRWSPEAPYLYHVLTEVHAGGELADVVTVPLGIRAVAADGGGFYLNGAPYPLVGTNRHQDFPGLGSALPDGHHRRDVQLVKDTGFNFLRLAHYPQDPAVLEATDRLGLAVWEEIPLVNTITMSEAFAENAERMLVEMIRQHYNHPSVVLWGLMNEILLRKPRPMPEGYLEAVHALAERLQAAARREDPSRPTALAVSYHEVYDGSGVSGVADVLGMNLYFGWYYERFEDFGPFLDSLHAAHPERPLFVSEYGAGSDERVHARRPVAFDFSSEHAQNYHRSSLAQIRARPYLAGSAVWNQFDFGSAHRQDTKNAINQKGLYFFDRTPKDIAFYYRAVLTGEPVLHLEREHRHRATRSPEDAVHPVLVYTNADGVALRHGGVTSGEQVPAGGVARFVVPLVPGANPIEAVGRWGTETRTDRVVIDLAVQDSAAALRAVNVGAAYDFVDPTGLVYLADPRAIPGAGGGARRIHHRIYGTDDDPRFQAFREGIDALEALPPGAYELTFGFMEPTHEAAGMRVFSVFVGDIPVLSDLDLAAAAGRWTALERKVHVVVPPSSAPLPVTFRATHGLPILSSLVIRRL
ncbi:MAG: glycoside hydrolase family 2 TIM barrel-domain containing protein [Rhodothermales bacterium]|nr:glycoside hydrolase family 2 TIM barrel-domain containing protein [Rhodothermales bacterium]